MTTLIHDPGEFRAACNLVREGAERLGLVPTMGALHSGHMALVDEARRRGATKVALTIFVNPLQFGPSEDLERYPRTLESDMELCRALGVDMVFAPHASAMYPPGFQSKVVVSEIAKRLEGAARPGHFEGVATVVTKLFQIAGPCVAVFGRKDYQQWCVLRRMVRDLDMPIDVIGMPTVRDPDGLALSSRNRYLSPEERTRALAISTGLRDAHAAFASGERDLEALRARVFAPIAGAFDSIDYVELADPDTLEALETGSLGPGRPRVLITVAARIGATRLIDNTVLGEDEPPRSVG